MYDLEIEDKAISNNIDVALKYVRLQEDYNAVMNSLQEE